MPITVSAPSVVPRRVSVTTGSVPGAGQATIAVTWPTAFPDDTYTVVATVEINEAGDSLMARRILSRTATGCSVNVMNSAITAKTGTLHVMATTA